MPDTFTPEQISQILEEFFKVVGTRQYIGARYVPIFGRKDEASIEWDNTAPYEPLTIVLYQGNSYTSRQFVPIGVDITNQEFWAITGNYNAQIEMYRRETAAAKAAADAAQSDIDTLLPKADFSAENTIKNYIDNENEKYGYSINNPIYYGADNTGVNDSSAAIQACINANNGSCIVFTPGTYSLTTPIIVPNDVSKRVCINLNGAILKATAPMSAMIQYERSETATIAGAIRTFIQNGYLENTNDVATSAISIGLNYKDLAIENMEIRGFSVGIDVGEVGASSDAYIDNCLIYYWGMTAGSVGVRFNGADNKISNCRVYGFRIGIDCKRSGHYIRNVHFLPRGASDSVIAESICIYIEYVGSMVITDCYFDTYGTAIKYASELTNPISLTVANCLVFINAAISATFLDFSDLGEVGVLGSIIGNTIQFSESTGASNVGIKLPAGSTHSLNSMYQYLKIGDNNIIGQCSYSDLILNRDVVVAHWPATIPVEHENDWIKIASIPILRGPDTMVIGLTSYNQQNYYEELVMFTTGTTGSLRKRDTSNTLFTFGGVIEELETNNTPYVSLYVKKNTIETLRLPFAVRIVDGLSHYLCPAANRATLQTHTYYTGDMTFQTA